MTTVGYGDIKPNTWQGKIGCMTMDKGHMWMNGEISDAIERGILTPVSKLRVKEEEEEDFNQGVIFEKTAEILTRGHQVSLSVNSRIKNVKSRSEFSCYVVEPTKFKLEKVVRILATVWKFIRSFKVVKRRNMNKEVKPFSFGAI